MSDLGTIDFYAERLILGLGSMTPRHGWVDKLSRGVGTGAGFFRGLDGGLREVASGGREEERPCLVRK